MIDAEAPTLRVRNWERHQRETEAQRHWFSVDVAGILLDDEFKGTNGSGVYLLGQWVKVLAWAARFDNKLPIAAAWWRQEFGTGGVRVRDRFCTLRWLVSGSGLDDETVEGPVEGPGDPRQTSLTVEGLILPAPRDVPVADSCKALSNTITTTKNLQLKTTSLAAAETLDMVSSEATPNAGIVVGEFVDVLRSLEVEPPRRVVGQFAQAIGKLLAEGQSADAVRAGLARMVERRVIRAQLLPDFIVEALLPENRKPVRAFGYGITPTEMLRAADRLEREGQ